MQVSNMDPSVDLSAVCDMFTNLVVVEVDRCKKIVEEKIAYFNIQFGKSNEIRDKIQSYHAFKPS